MIISICQIRTSKAGDDKKKLTRTVQDLVLKMSGLGLYNSKKEIRNENKKTKEIQLSNFRSGGPTVHPKVWEKGSCKGCRQWFSHSYPAIGWPPNDLWMSDVTCCPRQGQVSYVGPAAAHCLWWSNTVREKPKSSVMHRRASTQWLKWITTHTHITSLRKDEICFLTLMFSCV